MDQSKMCFRIFIYTIDQLFGYSVNFTKLPLLQKYSQKAELLQEKRSH